MYSADQKPISCTFTASKYRRAEMEPFLESLKNMGLDISYKFSDSGRTVEVTAKNIPHPDKAELKRTRGAGLKQRPIMPPAGSIFNSDTPCTEFLEWRYSPGVTMDQAAKELGISRTTYYRQQIEQKMKDRIARCERENPKRIANGWTPLTATLKDITRGSNTYMGKKRRQETEKTLESLHF